MARGIKKDLTERIKETENRLNKMVERQENLEKQIKNTKEELAELKLKEKQETIMEAIIKSGKSGDEVLRMLKEEN